MERKDVKRAVDRRLHVLYNGTEYYVTAYRYWSNDRTSGESLELHDLKANSILTAPISDVDLLDVYKEKRI